MQKPTTLSWKAPEFKHYEKSYSWYITLSAIAILIIAFFVIQKDLFAAVSIGILAILIILFAGHKPTEIEIKLSIKGVHLKDLFIPYKQIKHFWVVDNQNHKTVNLQTTAYLNNIIILELSGQDPDETREFLRQFIPEHEESDETIAQRISHKFKF